MNGRERCPTNQPAPAAPPPTPAIPPDVPQPRLTKTSDARKALLEHFEIKREQWAQRKKKNDTMPRLGGDKEFDSLIDSFHITTRSNVGNLYREWRDGHTVVVPRQVAAATTRDETLDDLKSRCSPVDELIEHTMDSRMMVWTGSLSS
jgi:hypothetical protein